MLPLFSKKYERGMVQMQKEQQEKRTVNGYRFVTVEDAQLALQEKEKAAYLERHMDYRNTRNMLAIYHKAIESGTFRTPVGFEYLKKLQSFLEKTPLKDEVEDIPVSQRYVLSKEKAPVEARQRVRSDPTKELRHKYKMSILVNLILTVLVISMFVITLKGENPNIVNYRNAVTNEYSAWEQELTERENAIREKEKELHINP